MALAAIFAPLFAPYDPNQGNLIEALAGPSGSHLLGTDGSGRDILSRLIYGARPSLGGPAVVVVISTLVGGSLGLLGGFLGGFLDGALGRLWDLMLAFPSLLLAIVIVATFGRGLVPAVLAISVTYIPLMARVVRGLVVSERHKQYIAACRLQGFGTFRLVFLHLLPNISGPLIAQLTLNFGYALLDLVALSFIGLGVRPPTADWGSMLADGKSTILTTANPVIWPSIAIILAVICVNLVGQALSDRIQRSL
ncbi:MAG: ABC transporter permease [Actinobacteria bacterium]|nr:ABC transporter permease [Actinomycetota bacterium]MBS1882229.1 ABC transporter permease [Actinomycetota bacterium]